MYSVRHLVQRLNRIRKLVNDPALNVSYFPDSPRKSRARITADMLHWLATRREVNGYYYCWGMDRLDGPDPSDLLSYREFHRIRQRRNRLGEGAGVEYIALMQDKYLFSLLMRALDAPAPELLATITSGRIDWLHPRCQKPLDSLLDVEDGFEAFCKPRYGLKGKGAFRLRVSGGVLHVNGAPITLDALAHMATDHVMQEPVQQHPRLAELHSASVNTLRIITVRSPSGAKHFSKVLFRVGAGGNVVDNGGAGGVQMFVNSETGRVIGAGIKTRGGMLTHHPDTGIPFDGFEVPCVRESIELVERLHDMVPGLHSIGWDLAVTSNGPVIIEGNDDWAAGLRIGLEPGFRQAFLDAFATP